MLKVLPAFCKDSFSVTFSLLDIDFAGLNFDCSLHIPDSYPKGNFILMYGDESQVYNGDGLCEVLEDVMEKFRKIRKKAMRELITPNSEIDLSDEGVFESDDDDDDDDDDEEEEEEEGDDIDLIEGLVNEINEMKNEGLVAIKGASGFDNVRLYLMIDPKSRLNISDLIANCWGIDFHVNIVISLTMSSEHLAGNIKPEVESFQGEGDPTKLDQTRKKFGLSWTVCERLRNDFFPRTKLDRFGRIDDPGGEKHGMNVLFECMKFVERTINGCPYFCLVCGKTMEHVGIKPSVCSNSVCIFSHENFGLGLDLETEIMKNSEIVDLLITMTYASASAPQNKGFNPFDPYPFDIHTKIKDPKTGDIIILDFLTNKERDNAKVLQVVRKVPPLKTLQEKVKKQKLRSFLNELDPRMYNLLRWIITSNRCHLHKLSKEYRVEEMNTEHQFIMMSGTPEKEAKYNQLKRRYGSIQAFHGSPLYNWHSIMRLGLKNMSNTKGMLHGAAAGSGVYFAKDAATSTGYMKFQYGSQCWPNSMFGTTALGMMALCEIIKHPNYSKMPNPYYVIPDENHIQTRLFFIYSTIGTVTCEGEKAKIPKIKWFKEEDFVAINPSLPIIDNNNEKKFQQMTSMSNLSVDMQTKVLQLQEIIGQDSEISFYYLNLNDWDIQRATNSFFGAT